MLGFSTWFIKCKMSKSNISMICANNENNNNQILSFNEDARCLTCKQLSLSRFLEQICSTRLFNFSSHSFIMLMSASLLRKKLRKHTYSSYRALRKITRLWNTDSIVRKRCTSFRRISIEFKSMAANRSIRSLILCIRNIFVGWPTKR